MRKRILSLLLALTLTISLVCVPVSAAGTPTIELTADKTTVLSSSTEQELEISVLLHNPNPETSKVSGISFDLKSDKTELALASKATTLTTAFGAGYTTYNTPRFTALKLEGLYAGYISETEVTLMTIKATLAANAPSGKYIISTDEMSVSDTEANGLFNTNVSITINVVSAISNDLPVDITKPTKGGTPETAITGANYTGSITWDPTVTGGKFAANTEYTANVTLNANTGYQFASDVNPSVAGATRVTDINVAPEGKTLTFKAEFPATDTATLKGILIPGLTVAVPTAKPNETQTKSTPIVVVGVYDDPNIDQTVAATLEIVGEVPGVSLEGNTLKVTNHASAGKVKVKASFSGKTDLKDVTITKDTPAASAIVATPPATGTDIAVPNGGTNTSGNCSYKVYDQYGAEMTGISATWKMEPETVTGVTLIPANGSISVNNAATTCTVKLHAESGALKSNEIIFNIIREESKPSVVTITGADSMNVPIVHAPGADGWNHEDYTATVKDQYGAVIPNPSVEWSVTDATGVSIDNTTGKLTVSNKANAGTVTITATSGDATNTKTVTINKAAAKETFVKITAQDNEPPVTLIICTGSPRLEYYTATVYDQYGKEIQDEVTWSLDPDTYSGVSYEISATNNNNVTLRVAPDTAPGTFKLVATSKTITTVKGDLKITVQKKNDVSTKINFNNDSLTYNGEGQKYENAALDNSVTPGTGGHWAYTYAVKSGSTGTLDTEGLPKTVGTYTVTVTYEDSTNVGSKTVELTIAPKAVTVSGITAANKVYDGGTDATPTGTAVINGKVDGDELTVDTSRASATFNDKNVGTDKTVTFSGYALGGTAAGNYTLSAQPDNANADITAREVTLTGGINATDRSYVKDNTTVALTKDSTLTFTGLVSGETLDVNIPATGTISDAKVGTYNVIYSGVTLKNGTTGKASNYTLNATLPTVTVNITKADAPKLEEITVSQKYTVTTEQSKDIGTAGMPADAGKLTYKEGDFTCTGSVQLVDGYVDANGKVTYKLSGGKAGDTVALSVIIGSDNYADATVNVVINLTKPSSSGGGGGVTTYPITVKSAKNGDVTASHKSASKGTAVTLTVDPDKGYVLDTLTVLDGKDKELKLTEKKGKYTFTMPAGKVTVKATFKAEQTTGKNPFIDVPAGSYYEDAVVWAVEKGITSGTSAVTFDPNGICTRAQAVTFLWRAAGSPAPKTKVMPFADVKAGSYYYDAVLWAVEQGITKGSSETMFSPNATCTRAQIVTFLWRANGSPAVSGNPAFTDVASDAYYAAAVKWAEKNDVTGGIGGGLFGSNNNCTRAQIVTFLYRSVK